MSIWLLMAVMTAIDLSFPLLTWWNKNLFTAWLCLSVSLSQSKKHANKVRLFYMLHPEDGGPPSKRLRPDNPVCSLFFLLAYS